MTVRDITGVIQFLAEIISLQTTLPSEQNIIPLLFVLRAFGTPVLCFRSSVIWDSEAVLK